MEPSHEGESWDEQQSILLDLETPGNRLEAGCAGVFDEIRWEHRDPPDQFRGCQLGQLAELMCRPTLGAEAQVPFTLKLGEPQLAACGHSAEVL